MHLKNLYKGAKPIEKNVIVVDEQGNEYEATYPKRAKGLVKSGRARYGVAVANACAEAKAAANYHTVSNDESAIARVIADIESGKMRF